MVDRDFRLTDDGFKKFCEAYHERVAPWRETFRLQADKLKRAVIEGCTYEPYSK
jgi:hypothetical protein